MAKLKIGDVSPDGVVKVIDEDRLCYQVINIRNSSSGIRTISKRLLGEFVDYLALHPDAIANEVRDALKDQSDIDKFEYGYAATLCKMAKMVLGKQDEREKEPVIPPFSDVSSAFRPYVAAIKSKPFVLLAGLSGTGKSRIARELARACWPEGSPEHLAQKPRNFEMVQVKPNWHDSSELLGYVSRVGDKPEFVAGDFLRFVARAWGEPDVPYFLCLDEMNLAPVEQYFAEYLSVVESRRLAPDAGTITTDPIMRTVSEQWYYNLAASLTKDLADGEALRQQFLEQGICLPQNLIVIGTVNMDETTFSFSRKVLDRAMTIEMNAVDLRGGLETRHEAIGRLGAAELIGTAVEGVDVYAEHKEVCDAALNYLQAVNAALEGTPFKVAYRTRNEFLLYAVNNLPYGNDAQGGELTQGRVVARALDEITNMKILPRIEGDETKVGNRLLDKLAQTIKTELDKLAGEDYSAGSVSLAKLREMKNRLESGYTSFWS